MTSYAPPYSADFFEENSAVASHMVQYLGVRSLIRFATSRKAYHDLILLPEVSRRKAQFAQYEEKVNNLLPGTNRPIDNRENILEALSLYKSARDLVDSELAWCDDLVWTEPDEQAKETVLVLMRRNPFFDQVRRLAEVTDYPPSHPAFYVLPKCFYLPPSRPPGQQDPSYVRVTKNHIAAGKHYASWIWGAEDHMGSFYEMGLGWDPYFRDQKYPFRKFEHPLNQFFLECMQDLVFKLKSDKALKATFRLAACNLALQRPGSTDCLHYVLHHADAPSEDDSDDHSDSGGDNDAAAASDGGET